MTSVLTGQYLVNRMVMRVRLLEKIEEMLNTISCEIRFLSTPADRIIKQLCEKNEYDELIFLRICNEKISSGSDFKEAWLESLNALVSKLYLNKNDLTLIRRFGSQFGTTDAEGQISICSMYLESIKNNLQDSRSKKEQYANLVNGISVLFGIGIIVVFI